MTTFRSLVAVSVDYNLRPTVEDGNEVWRASCHQLDAEVLKVGELVLAVTEVPGEGFVARVHHAPYARGQRLDPLTGQGKQVYRVEVTPVDISALLTVEQP